MAQNKLILLSCFLILSLSLSAQNEIKGRVYDAQTGEALEKAQISLLSDSTHWTLSDKGGIFSLNLTHIPEQIEVQYLGYEKQILSVQDAGQFLTITLSPSEIFLPDVIVSALRSPRPLFRQTGTLALITPTELRRDPDLILAPALNRIPGIYMHSGALNTNRITIRGIGTRTPFGTNKVRAYIDDIPLTSGEGETTLEDVDLSLVERVEILKGPASSIFGAGLGGTINLMTSPAAGGENQFSSILTLGSYGLLRSVNQLSLHADQLSLGLNYNLTQSDGYRDNNQYRREGFQALGKVYSGEKGSLSFLASYVDLRAQIPSSLDSSTFVDDPSAAATIWKGVEGFEDYGRGLLGLSYRYRFSSRLENRSSIFTGWRHSYELRPFNILREQNQSLGARTLFSFSPTETLVLTGGGEYFLEWYDWRTYAQDERLPGALLSDQEELRSYYNLFAQADWDLSPTLLLSAGLNFNDTRYQLTDRYFADSLDQSGNYRFKPILSPRIGLNFRPSPTLAMFATVSHGFSPPSVSETLTPEGLPNPDIQPEQGWNFEIGARGRFLHDRMNLDLSLFTMPIRDLLVARRVDLDQFVGVNAGKTLHSGLEADLRYRIVQNPTKGLSLLQAFANLSLADYRFLDFVDEDQDYSGNYLPGAPGQTFSAGFDLETKWGLYGNVNYQFVSDMYLQDANTGKSAPYHLGNIKLGWKKAFAQWLELELFGGVQNLWDEKYASMLQINAGGARPRYYYPGLPRNYYGGVRMGILWSSRGGEEKGTE